MELPPKKAARGLVYDHPFPFWSVGCITLLIEDENISTVQVDGVSGTETGHCATKPWSVNWGRHSENSYGLLTSTTDNDDSRRGSHYEREIGSVEERWVKG